MKLNWFRVVTFWCFVHTMNFVSLIWFVNLIDCVITIFQKNLCNEEMVTLAHNVASFKFKLFYLKWNKLSPEIISFRVDENEYDAHRKWASESSGCSHWACTIQYKTINLTTFYISGREIEKNTKKKKCEWILRAQSIWSWQNTNQPKNDFSKSIFNTKYCRAHAPLSLSLFLLFFTFFSLL